MSIKITWYGHNAWLVESEDQKILIDPLLNDSPTSPVKAEDVEADYILLSHGHGDHVGDTVNIAKRTGATVVTNYEISLWLAGQGIDAGHTVGMNPGGSIDMPFGNVKMTDAVHSSSLPDGSYGGVAMGMILSTAGKRIYFACDTALFGDMKLIGQPLDLAVLPIGDLFTMGPADSVEAVKLLQPTSVLPCHYNTWPPIEQDAEAWATAVSSSTETNPIVLQPGDSFTL